MRDEKSNELITVKFWLLILTHYDSLFLCFKNELVH